ncbi:hypothetical protein HMJ29_02425 [Hymenobacter taeanensis]|uniref:DUF4097 family beta strand repeat protein n=1 Tax=Hymenobacter taeanensis TaxID=2735321 RepID=A0A6M6BF43_9BACT|nr:MULTISPECIES: hypothetical protein [Hymenobacter]QJX45853.1 hypothetical protein HMJ29_02425 [Hymenobacter taeanensis]UOQ79697.1 hypothetical protein MUN83_12635 [Hymenobacter sp. 5414T-23]
MFRFILLLSVLLGLSSQGAYAQKVLEQKASLSSGQRLNLELKHATVIKIHPASGSEMVLRATVTVNGGQLNEAITLTSNKASDGLTIASVLDEKLVQTSQVANCPDGEGTTRWGGNWNNGKSGGGGICLRMEVDVAVPAGVAVRVNTISGNIEVNGLTAPLDVKSISGFVDVSWPPKQGADVAFKTITGEVYTDQDIAFVNRKDNPIVGYQVRGTMGGSGGPTVRLESVSGDVYFRQRK